MHLLFLDESGQLSGRKFFALGGVALRASDWPALRCGQRRSRAWSEHEAAELTIRLTFFIDVGEAVRFSHEYTQKRDHWGVPAPLASNRPCCRGSWVHQLRHTFASLMIASGCHPGVLKELMGHESIKTTIDTYGHLYPGATGAAINDLDAYLDKVAGEAAPSMPHR